MKIFSYAILSAANVFMGAPAQGPTSVDYATAVRLFEAKRYSDARALFQQVGTRRPDPADADLDYYLGRLALWFDDDTAGRAYLLQAAAERPADARIQNALGDAYGQTAQHASLFTRVVWARRCKGAYDRAVALDPANPDYHWSLLGFDQLAPALVGGGIDKAYAEAAAIKKLDDMRGRVAYATLYLAEKKADLAFAQFEPVLHRKPEDWLALFQVGRCAAISGQRVAAGIAALRRCLAAPPAAVGASAEGLRRTRLAFAHYRLAALLERNNDREGARREAGLARNAFPDFRPDKDALQN